jgi:hypothetical protein
MIPSRSKRQNVVLPKTFQHFDSLSKIKVKVPLSFFSLTQLPASNIDETSNQTTFRTLRYRDPPPPSCEINNRKSLSSARSCQRSCGPVFGAEISDKALLADTIVYHKSDLLKGNSLTNFQSIEKNQYPDAEPSSHQNTDRPRTENVQTPPRIDYKSIIRLRLSKKDSHNNFSRTCGTDFLSSSIRKESDGKGFSSSHYNSELPTERRGPSWSRVDNKPEGIVDDKIQEHHNNPSKVFHSHASLMPRSDEKFIVHLNSLPNIPAREIFRDKMFGSLRLSSSNIGAVSKKFSVGRHLSHGVIRDDENQQDHFEEIIERHADNAEYDDSRKKTDNSGDSEEIAKNTANEMRKFRRQNKINLSIKKRLLGKRASVVQKNTNNFIDNVMDLAEDFCKNFNEYIKRGSAKRLFRVLLKELDGFDSHFRDAIINITNKEVLLPMFPEYLVLKLQAQKWDPDPEEYMKTENKKRYLQSFLNFIGALEPKKVEKLAKINKVLTDHIIILRKVNVKLVAGSIVELEKKLAQKQLNQLDAYIYKGMGRHYSNYMMTLIHTHVESDPFTSNLGAQLKQCENRLGNFQKIDPRSKSMMKVLDSVCQKIKDKKN